MAKTVIKNSLRSQSLTILFIREGDSVIAYSPALDFSTCGKTKAQAKKRFEEAASMFFEDLVENNTLEKVLRGLGWSRGRERRSWQMPRVESASVGVRIPAFA